MSSSGEILVLGVGNILLSDDGLGVRALELLEKTYAFSSEVTLLDGGTGGLTLVSAFEGKGLVIILDAIFIEDGGRKVAPGKAIKIEGSRLESALDNRSQFASLHGIGISEVLTISALEATTPGVILIGMKPVSLAPGTELSREVADGLPAMADMVIAELKDLGVKVDKKNRTI